MNDFKEYKAAFLEQNDLAHFGILGMRWGVRRYQNPDGTLTAAGRKRYGTEENFNNIMNAAKKGGLIGAISVAKAKKQQKNKSVEKKTEVEDRSEKMKQWEKEAEENQKILDKEIYSASDKKFKSICREYYKDLKKKGDSRANRMSEDQFIDHMMDDGWQDDADDWYLRKYHQRSL